MRTRFTWIAAILALVSIGIVMACSTKYSATSNGLLVVSSDTQVMETFSINLSNGHASQINNVAGPVIVGLPSTVVIDPAGTYAYVATTVTCTPPNPAANTSLTAVQGAIVAFPIVSDGKLSEPGPATYLTGNSAYPVGFPTCGLDDATNPNGGNPIVAMTMDSTGKFLFVATAQTGAIYTTNTNTSSPIATNVTLNSPGITVYAIGANGSLTPAPGSPFALPLPNGGEAPNPSALAVTPTIYPVQFAVCAGSTPPATENLYVTDSVNYFVFNYSVNMSTGALEPPLNSTMVQSFPTGSIPMGVAVDPCNRFVYVANSTPASVSAYTVCSNVLSQSCLQPDFSLLPVTGSPFVISPGDFPGPITEDAYGNFLYVVDTGSNIISSFRISSATGKLTGLTPAVVATGFGPTSIAVRSDDSWLFVANINAASVSQYAITPSSGTLTPQSQPIPTFNYPAGVAVR